MEGFFDGAVLKAIEKTADKSNVKKFAREFLFTVRLRKFLRARPDSTRGLAARCTLSLPRSESIRTTR